MDQEEIKPLFNAFPFQARFDYPKAFVTLPDYTAHTGQAVTVTGLSDEWDVVPIYKIVASDGWAGCAFEDELLVLETA